MRRRHEAGPPPDLGSQRPWLLGRASACIIGGLETPSPHVQALSSDANNGTVRRTMSKYTTAARNRVIDHRLSMNNCLEQPTSQLAPWSGPTERHHPSHDRPWRSVGPDARLWCNDKLPSFMYATSIGRTRFLHENLQRNSMSVNMLPLVVSHIHV